MNHLSETELNNSLQATGAPKCATEKVNKASNNFWNINGTSAILSKFELGRKLEFDWLKYLRDTILSLKYK